ncbi:hypothetical protein TVAG_450080 [Trichomonas vaginalis G3]|uniref:Uncharacterized protein n=1 Tax=Trichomonas vaginalis (strain ATCC PRA-98 / G3) TaxID=412133 RepID=A2GF14_TRIV3|nr:hypothetical protein TVAGG3_0156580 [Trichomonas vaginalis G3]EAX84251.1 hypothetical protein TVAG_450080 [Trichomonas vaginalis G3]KAI5547592.1 hypothetical protein TVAGG3_0156580 [Trichomonas vaginalis G3]|eukprot:XP_001297181.1 hypothetical protein [Trichomonas vaginalis G3]
MQAQILQQLQRPPEQGPRLPQLFNNETQTILDYYIERDREYIQAAGLPVSLLPRHILLPKPRLLLDVHQFLENRDDETMKLFCNFNCFQFNGIYGSLKNTLWKKSRIDARVDRRDKIFLTLNWCKYAPTFRDLVA